MKTRKRVPKSLYLSAGVTLFTIAIYAMSHIKIGLRGPPEERPSRSPPFQSALHVAAARDLRRQKSDQPGYGSWFDGCEYVYLDGGSNMGLQIRKIFEPELYPDDPVLPIYDRIFGKDRSAGTSMCAIGFEANPHHTEKLQKLEAAYQAKGWRVKIFTGTALATHDGTAEFYFDTLAKPENHEWGASMVAWQKDMKESKAAGNDSTKGKTTVRTMDLAKYVLEHVASRHLPVRSLDTTEAARGVLLKLDIEGSEHELIPHMIIAGAMCQVGAIFYEEHGFGSVIMGGKNDTVFTSFFEAFVRDYEGDSCPTTFLSIDNESYGHSDFPLPV